MTGWCCRPSSTRSGRSCCGSRRGGGVVRPDTRITRIDTVNGVRVARLEHSAGACDACLVVAVPDLGITVTFDRIDEGTVVSILNTFDRSARWRALHEGPLADTSGWQTVDAGGAMRFSVPVPGDWTVHRVGVDPAAEVPWRCTDGFAATNAHTVVIDEQPVDMMSGCGQMAVGAQVDAIYVRPSQQDVYDLTQGDNTTANGATITVLPDIYPGASTIEVRIDNPGQPAVRASIGISADPLIARTILHRLGRPPQPAAGPPPTSTPGTTLTGTIPTPEEGAAGNRREAELAAAGWVAWSIDPVVPVTRALPDVGYLHTGPGASPPLSSPTPTVTPSPDGLPRSAMFDKPDGNLLGYYYIGLGFVPVETADAPGFDAGPLYTERGICVPGRSQECEDAKHDPTSTTK